MSGEGNLIGVIGQRANSSRFLLFDEQCLPVAPQHRVEVQQLLPKEGWFEQDPCKIWESVWQCLEVVGRKLQAGEVARLKGIGITNQRETTVLWDKTTGKPLRNAIMWCDVRAAEIADRLIAETPSKNKDHLQSRCGLPIHAYFSALKVKWLMEDSDQAVRTAMKEGKCLFGTVDTWIIWNLTGGVDGGVHVTDVTNASRTMLMNIHTLQWDPELCRFFDIPQEILPEIRSSAEVYGTMAEGKFKGIPICGILGDQQAVLVGQRCFSPGDAKITYGGGCYLLYNTGQKPVMSHHGMLTTVAYKLGQNKPTAYALEGVIPADESIHWLRDNLELFKDASEFEDIVGHVPYTGGVYFVPEVHAPYWQPDARRLVKGMTHNTSEEHFEAICFQSKEVLDAMNLQSELPLASLRVDGGLAVNDLLQLQANCLRKPVVRPDIREMSVLGAAVAAGIAVRIWEDVSMLPVPSTSSTFQPEITSDALQVQVEKALRKGYVLTDLTTCLASGAPGSGKTTLQYLLYKHLPPDTQISTAVIEEAHRSIISSVDCEDPEESHWKLVQMDDLKEMVAEGVSAEVESIKDELSSQLPHLCELEPSPNGIEITTIPVTDGPTVKPMPQKPQPQATTAATQHTSSTTLPLPSVVQKSGHTHPQAFELPADILNLMKTLGESRQSLRAHWLHYIDSGGQPQFLEVLAAFVRNISLLILLIKLSEKLSDPPSVEYFSRDGKFDLGVFPLSNEQLLVQAAQLSLFHRSQISLPHVETEPSQMKTVIVGTFKDQEGKCKESRDEKNSQLKQLLKPFEQQLIPRSESEIIFPVNAKSAGQGENEDPVASELRSAIQKFAPRLRIRFPLQWYFLEMELRKLGLKIITKSKCWEIAKKLGFDSEEALEAALLYLHEANLFLYYPDVLSNTVFVGSEAVISNITQLYEHHVELEAAPEPDVTEDDLRYRDQALFTDDILSLLDSGRLHFQTKAAFPDDDLLKLLQHRLIVAEMPFQINGKTCYLMPSLLPALEEGDIVRPQFTAASALLVTFPEGWAPIGLCCATVVSLLSRKAKLPLKIPELVSSNVSKLYKNRLEFSIGDHLGTITLVNTMKQFEVHPSSTLPVKLLPFIKQAIDQSLEEACSRYSYRVSHQFAFTCNCGVSPSHAALISLDKSTVHCTKDPEEVEPLSDKQKLWVLPQDYYTGSEKVEVMDQQIQTEIIETEHKNVQAGSTTKQQVGSDKVQVMDQQIQTETIETEHKNVQAGSQTKQQGYLRGVEVIDHTSFTYTSRAQSFEWVNHGFKLHLPEDALPPEVDECRLHIKASLSGQFQFPEDTELVSGIYWIATPHKFAKPVTVEIQHCSRTDHLPSLTYIVAQCTQEVLPYHFSILSGGVFAPSSRYGSINVTHFSGVGIASRAERRPSLIQRLVHRFRQLFNVKSYCARLYYSKSGIHSWEVYFAITWNLDLHIAAVDAWYAKANARMGPCQEVLFEGDKITLGISEGGIELKNGWTIIPVTYPAITKRQVDEFVPGRLVPSCQLYAKLTRQQEQSVELVHRVELLGAKEPFTFFLIRPPSLPTPLATQSAVQSESSSKLNAETPIKEGAKILAIVDLADITSYLHPLGRTAVFNLGVVMGLDYNRLKPLIDSPDFLADMLAGWLQRVDQVQKAGVPTWKRLVEALRDPRVGQNGIASNIEQDKL